jgi:hypothetical protein
MLVHMDDSLHDYPIDETTIIIYTMVTGITIPNANLIMLPLQS